MVREYLSPGFFDALDDDEKKASSPGDDNDTNEEYDEDTNEEYDEDENEENDENDENDENEEPTPAPSTVRTTETMLVLVPQAQSLKSPEDKGWFGSWFGRSSGCSKCGGGWKKVYNY